MKHECRIISKEEVLANRSSAYEFIDFDKQETLEEVIGRQFQFNSSSVIKDEKPVYLINKHSFKIAVDNILKWQQEQILDFLYSEITERRDYSASKMCEKVIEFIEQFKNK